MGFLKRINQLGASREERYRIQEIQRIERENQIFQISSEISSFIYNRIGPYLLEIARKSPFLWAVRVMREFEQGTCDSLTRFLETLIASESNYPNYYRLCFSELHIKFKAITSFYPKCIKVKPCLLVYREWQEGQSLKERYELHEHSWPEAKNIFWVEQEVQGFIGYVLGIVKRQKKSRFLTCPRRIDSEGYAIESINCKIPDH